MMMVERKPWRHLMAAAMLMALAACTTSNVARVEDPGVDPNQGGKTNDPAAGYASMQPGSEEDFTLNVGRRIFFTSGSAALDQTAKMTLDKQAAWLKANPQWLVKVQGFADDPGSASAQQSLSQKRADAVLAYLAADGVDTKRLWAKGYGKDRMVRDCPDTACKVQNRRVVVNLRNEKDT